jgi:serine O-acetyltransferase
MTPERLALLRIKLTKLWWFSPEKLWLLSIGLQRRGHWVLAFSVKQVNTVLYHNSLSPRTSVSPDVLLGHYGHGIVVGSQVVIGRRVKIWHNVTLTAGRAPRRGEPQSAPRTPAQIIIEDDVKIGTNVVVIAPRGGTIRIGRGARIGAGVVVTHDVPARATVVAPAPRVLLADATPEERTAEETTAEEATAADATAADATAAERTASEATAVLSATESSEQRSEVDGSV